MTDAQCVRFLQWALPQLRMRWDGFRKVRGQVKKRLTRRLRELGLPDIEAYRDYLRRHAGEWHKLDALCRITISRFYRDKGVYAALSQQVLPTLARAARQRRDKTLRVWSAGCGGGEEPYTISILWHLELRDRYPDLQIDIVATDADPAMLARAREDHYAFPSVKDLPASARGQAFEHAHGAYRLKPAYRRDITFLEQDIRNVQRSQAASSPRCVMPPHWCWAFTNSFRRTRGNCAHGSTSCASIVCRNRFRIPVSFAHESGRYHHLRVWPIRQGGRTGRSRRRFRAR
jgi:chemotaxis protein methyltransferase CheR